MPADAKNFDSITEATDEDVLAISMRLIAKNKDAYKTLAQQ